MPRDRAGAARQADVLAQAHVRLEAWRDAGADRLAPTRFAFLSALATRMGRLEGNARHTLETRLAALLDDYAAIVSKAGADKPKAGNAKPGDAASGPLIALVERLGRQAQGLQAPTTAVPAPAADFGNAAPQMPALEEFRGIWNSVRSERQVRRTLEQAPVGAGPLNSTALSHRAITLMQSLSPGYLQHFLAYVDTLSWLEQMQLGGVLTSAVASSARAAPVKKAARKRPRGKRTPADAGPADN
jgi:hypothetical protein